MNKRVLVAGVGYRFLRDLSVGPLLVSTLLQQDWPPEVEIDDYSFGPIAVVQRLEDRPHYFDRIVFVATVERGRQPGQIYCYRWGNLTLDPLEVQIRVSEAVTGVISLDNLLIICTYFGVLPAEVAVIEVEPAVQSWGEDFSEPVQVAFEALPALVRQMLTQSLDQLPLANSLA